MVPARRHRTRTDRSRHRQGTSSNPVAFAPRKTPEETVMHAMPVFLLSLPLPLLFWSVLLSTSGS
jgi:hypothetical protein